MKRTVALVGATGGAGTTRLCVEVAALLAHAGRDVAVLDAAFATQGLARHAPGRIDPDATALLTDTDVDLSDALVDHPADLAGRLALCPAYAPFERLARAKTAEAAERFEDLITEAAREFDHVLVDTPPVAANQAVAAANAVERVALVAPATERGADAVQRARGRLADVGVTAETVVATRATDDDQPVDAADAVVPANGDAAPASAPDLDAEFSPAVARAAEALVAAELEVEFPTEGVLNAAREEYVPDEYVPDSLS
ncbi:ParA family protein [Halomicrococcus sp. SG-WS-1]|uniref:ParA family protein n=1 Tax=Halomicrococcus sp. SG-WS-1 TaxID=3439057 RepID=UPI003F7AE44F